MAEGYVEKPIHDSGWITRNANEKYRVIGNLITYVLDNLHYDTTPSNPVMLSGVPAEYKPITNINYSPYAGQTFTIAADTGYFFGWSLDATHTYTWTITYMFA